MKIINTTLEVDPLNLSKFENTLRANFKVIDFKIIPDTKQLYDEDEVFRKIVKGVKKANLEKDRYINKHNYK